MSTLVAIAGGFSTLVGSIVGLESDTDITAKLFAIRACKRQAAQNLVMSALGLQGFLLLEYSQTIVSFADSRARAEGQRQRVAADNSAAAGSHCSRE